MKYLILAIVLQLAPNIESIPLPTQTISCRAPAVILREAGAPDVLIIGAVVSPDALAATVSPAVREASCVFYDGFQ